MPAFFKLITELFSIVFGVNEILLDENHHSICATSATYGYNTAWVEYLKSET